jgi:hypothetical protein
MAGLPPDRRPTYNPAIIGRDPKSGPVIQGGAGHAERLDRPEGSYPRRLCACAVRFAATRGEGQLAIHAADSSVQGAHHADECLEFVRFCYRRRRVAWPLLYDEMCAVAARGAYHGLGFAELAERGVTFCLSDMPRLTELLEQVIAEERTSPEPSLSPAPLTLSVVPAAS